MLAAPSILGTALALAGPSANTLYALNCMGCHLPPAEALRVTLPLGAHFTQDPAGRAFFINTAAGTRRVLTADENQRLSDEILSWKRSCHVILQQAPLVDYRGERSVK
jgi:hypothetical protein